MTIIGAIIGLPAIIFSMMTLSGKRNMKTVAGVFGRFVSLIGGIFILVGDFTVKK